MNLGNKVCVVTGASSGIGRALALALAGAGGHVWAIGRSRARLVSLSKESAEGPGSVTSLVVDFEVDDLESVVNEILVRDDRVDVLVHSAGAIARGPVASASLEEFDRQYRVNLRAPFVLTRALLPALKRCRGQIVFINSSAALAPSPDAAVYSATKQGLKAFADGLRQEVNADGVRVVSIYPGRTSTPLQKAIHEHEGRRYLSQFLLRPEDVVDVVFAALSLDPAGEITDIHVRPMRKLPER